MLYFKAISELNYIYIYIVCVCVCACVRKRMWMEKWCIDEYKERTEGYINGWMGCMDEQTDSSSGTNRQTIDIMCDNVK